MIVAALAAMQLANGYFASQNMKDTAELNRQISDMNAEFAELDAYDAITEGYTAQARYQGVIDQTLGEQQLALTAADIDVNYGSAASIKEETKFIGEMNLMEIQKQAEERALGFKSQARNFRSGGALQLAQDKQRANTVMFNSVAGAAKTSLSGYRPAYTEDSEDEE